VQPSVCVNGITREKWVGIKEEPVHPLSLAADRLVQVLTRVLFPAIYRNIYARSFRSCSYCCCLLSPSLTPHRHFCDPETNLCCLHLLFCCPGWTTQPTLSAPGFGCYLSESALYDIVMI
jgi:hypothetical protein